jgi:hypothetical protein
MKDKDKRIGNWTTPGGNYPKSKLTPPDRNLLISWAVIILLLLTAALFTSCITQKRVDKICLTCKPDSVIIKTDSIYAERIDTVYKMSAWDSLLLVSTWNPNKITDTIIIEDTHWKGQFYISQGTFKAQLSYLKDSITQIVKTIETISNTSQQEIIKVPIPVNVPIRDKRFRFYRSFTWISSILVLLLLGVWVYFQVQKGKMQWIYKFKR